MGKTEKKLNAVVTGGSSGIGKACAEALTEAGYTVYELSRSGKDEGGILHISADVTKLGAVAAAADKLPDPDLLVCCAGMGISGAVEFTEPDEAKRLFDVNFFGTVNTLVPFIPKLRRTKGKIVIISSVAAEFSIPFQVYYSSSKAALNSLASGLANELSSFGIGVCALMPGDVKTGFTSARQKLHRGDDIYGGSIGRSVSKMERDEENGVPASVIAKKLVSIAKKKKLSPIYCAPASYGLLVFAKRLLPTGLLNALVAKLYVK